MNLFDTAEVYGAGLDPNSWGYSEVLCGRFARQYQGTSQDEVLVATKFAPLPHRFFDGRKSVSKALRASLERLGTDRVDLYQLHWPGFFADAAFWDGLADTYEAGLVRAVGVSNYSVCITCEQLFGMCKMRAMYNMRDYSVIFTTQYLHVFLKGII